MSVYDLATRLYFEQFEPPGCCQAIPIRVEFDEIHEIVILRSGGKVVATYGVCDFYAAEEQWEEEWEATSDEEIDEVESHEPEPEHPVPEEEPDNLDDWNDFEEF